MLRFVYRLFALNAIALWITCNAGVASASVISLTGEDLFNSSDVSFPTTTPTLSGTSLIFGPGSQAHEKLFVLPIIPGGTLTPSGTATISITINLTRLACDDTCVGALNDFDPHIMLGDGSSLVGGLTADNGGGQGFAVEMTDGGNVGTNRNFPLLFEGAGFPAIGNAFDVTLVLTLGETFTTMDLSYLSGSGSYTSAVVFDRAQDLSLLLVRDNDISERYQVNSLMIEAPTQQPASVPEPGSLALLASGLAALGLLTRRRKRFPAPKGLAMGCAIGALDQSLKG